jgi:hypothetical protein
MQRADRELIEIFALVYSLNFNKAMIQFQGSHRVTQERRDIQERVWPQEVDDETLIKQGNQVTFFSHGMSHLPIHANPRPHANP